jgi:hypothetical protein
VDDGFWQAIVDADYAVPEDHSIDALTAQLLTLLGSTDPLRRDTFAYSILAEWIFAGRYDADRLRAMVDERRPNLAVGLGEEGTETVFRRSFSALMLAALAERDVEQPFLGPSDVRRLLDDTVAYASAERDLRGYVPRYGWAHAAAHTADLLGALARSPHFGQVELEQILAAVALLACKPSAYLHDEDDRLARAVVAVLEPDQLGRETVIAWATRIAQPEGESAWTVGRAVDGHAGERHNVRNVLRSIFLRLTFASDPPPVAPALLPVLAATLRAMASD